MAKKKLKTVERLVIFFRTDDGKNADLLKENFGLSVLLETLVNQRYTGPNLRFVNVTLVSTDFLAKHNSMPLGHTSKDMSASIAFDQRKYVATEGIERREYVWQLACDALLFATEKFGFDELSQSVKGAQVEGLSLGLNTDHLLLHREKMIGDINIDASIWVSFRPEMMISTLIVSASNHAILKKELHQGGAANEFFLTMYKDIVIAGNAITVKISRDAGAPIKVPIDYGIVN